MSKKVLDALAKKFGDKIVDSDDALGDETVWVAPENLIEVATWLKDDPATRFDSPVFVTCIDRLGLPPTRGREAVRFEVCVQLRSMEHKHRIRIKVPLEGDGEDEAPTCPSLSTLWRGFDWQERETFDMYGVVFEGHEDLRRIYMYEEFVGYPLRKDYPKDKRQPLVRRDWSD